MKTAEARARRMKEGTDRRRGEIPSSPFGPPRARPTPPPSSSGPSRRSFYLPSFPFRFANSFTLLRSFLCLLFLHFPSLPPPPLPRAISRSFLSILLSSISFNLPTQLGALTSLFRSFSSAFLRSSATHSRTLSRHHRNNELYRYEYRGTRGGRWILKMTRLLQDESRLSER